MYNVYDIEYQAYQITMSYAITRGMVKITVWDAPGYDILGQMHCIKLSADFLFFASLYHPILTKLKGQEIKYRNFITEHQS